MPFSLRSFSVVGLGMSAVSPLLAIVISGSSTLENDRFANDDSFVADQFDLSGVGLNGRWATMISENVYITAEHFAPGVGSSVTFYAGNDPSGPSLTRLITSDRLQIGATDIFVGTLDSPLSSAYTFYDFATEDITGVSGGPGSFSESIYDGANAYVFGRSDSTFPTSQDMAVGRNVLDRFSSSVFAADNTGDAIAATDDRPDGVTFESQLEVGDSGGPLFVENTSGGLTIVGINWFVGTRGGEDILGATYVGNYDEEIQAFIDANVVPEPSKFALYAGFACGVLLVRRRRRGAQ